MGSRDWATGEKIGRCWECAGYGCSVCGEYPEDPDCPNCTSERLCASCTWEEVTQIDPTIEDEDEE